MRIIIIQPFCTIDQRSKPDYSDRTKKKNV